MTMKEDFLLHKKWKVWNIETLIETLLPLSAIYWGYITHTRFSYFTLALKYSMWRPQNVLPVQNPHTKDISTNHSKVTSTKYTVHSNFIIIYFVGAPQSQNCRKWIVKLILPFSHCDIIAMNYFQSDHFKTGHFVKKQTLGPFFLHSSWKLVLYLKLPMIQRVWRCSCG